MGASSSRIVTQPQQEPAQAHSNSQQISKLIEDFTKSIEMYKSNDMSQIKEFIRKHYPEGENELLDVINKIDNSLGKSSESNSDKNLYDKFKEINEAGLQKLKKPFVDSPIIGEDPELKSKIDGIFTPFSNLRTEAMFYRYKYIQVNIILIILVTQFQSLFDTTFSAISANFSLKLEKYNKLLNHFIEITQKLSENTNVINDQDRKEIEKVSDKAIKQLENFIEETEKKIKELSDATPNYLVKMLLETNQLTLDQVQKSTKT